MDVSRLPDDVLGPTWCKRVLSFPRDDEGPVIATLIQRRNIDPDRPAVLYVHGYIDYFFQEHLALEWEDRGYAFYAIDLRKHGRSLLPHQSPNFCRDLREYWADLDAAIAVLRRDYGHTRVIVHAHSTGGLTASLWAHYRRGRGLIDALALNSPWFELNDSWFNRTVTTAVVDVIGASHPYLTIPAPRMAYGRSIHRSATGSWDYDLDWKPLDGFPVYLGWLRAVRRGHARIRRGLAIDVPVLVCCSTRSGPTTTLHANIHRTDSMLNVEHIAARAVLLGQSVTITRIPDGIHDLALSQRTAREAYFDAMFRWTAAAVSR